MLREWNNVIKKCILLLFFSVIAGFCLLVLVYLLPEEKMKARTLQSIDIFYTEGVYPQLIQGQKGTQLDNETDAIMLLNAIDEGTGYSLLERAAAVPRIYLEGENSSCVTLVRTLWENVPPSGRTEYGRYWHGYLIWLKPLLLLFNYGHIRYINMFVQCILFVLVIVFIIENGEKPLLLPFVAANLFINPVATSLSLQFSSIYYIVLLSFVILLKKRQYFSRGGYQRYCILFFVIGIATAYFDFLTYPTLALTMPLMLVLYLEKTEWKTAVKYVVVWSVFWGVGYAGMWLGKWILCFMILQSNIFAEVLERIMVHTGNIEMMGEKFNGFEVIWKNIKVYINKAYLLLMAVGLIFYTWKYRIFCKNNLKKWNAFLPILLIAMIPFLWIFITKSHAGWVYWYASRGLAGTVFACLTLGPYMERNR